MIEATIYIDPVTLTQVNYDPEAGEGDYTPGEYHAGWGFVAALPVTVTIGPIMGGVDTNEWVPGLIAAWHRAQPQRVFERWYEGWDHELGCWPPYGTEKYPYGKRLALDNAPVEIRGLDNFSQVLRQQYLGALRERLDAKHFMFDKYLTFPIERDGPRNWWGR